MNAKKKLFFSTLGNGSFALFQALNIFILARLGGAEAVGIYSFCLAFINPVILLTNIGLRNVVIANGFERYSFQDYKKTRTYLNAVAILMILFYSAFSGEELYLLGVIVFLAIAKVAESKSDLTYGFMQSFGLYGHFAFSLATRSFLGFLALASGLFFTNNLLFSSFLYALVWGGCYLFIDKYWLRSSVNQIAASCLSQNGTGWSSVKAIILTSMPLGFVNMLISLSVSIPRLVLEDVVGLEELGVFASFFMLLQFGSLVVSSLGQVAVPQLAKHSRDREWQGFLKVYLQSSFFAFLLGSASFFFVSLFSEGISDLLFGSDYVVYKSLLVAIFLVAPFQYLNNISGYALVAAKKNKVLLAMHCFSVFNISLLSWILIGRYGLVGAAYGVLINSAILSAVYLFSVSFVCLRLRSVSS